MQFILAILALLLYAAVYAVGFIVVGIVELVKYIRARKEESRKAKEHKENKTTSQKSVEDLQNDITPVTSTAPTQIETEPTIVPTEENSDLQQNLNIVVPNDSIDEYIAVDSRDSDDIAEDTAVGETDVSVAEEIIAPEEAQQVLDNLKPHIGDIILALQEHLNNKENHTEQILSSSAIEETENCKALLGNLIEALTKHQQGRSTDDIQITENHRELLDLVSSLKLNAELKRASIISLLDGLSAAKEKVNLTVCEDTPSVTQHTKQDDITTPHKSSSPKPQIKREKKTESISHNVAASEPKLSISELAIFNNIIYHVKLLGHEDPRFKLIAIKAYEIITKFGDSTDFFMDIICDTDEADDFAMEVIRFIATQKILNVPDNVLIQRIREKYISKHKAGMSSAGNVFNAKPKSETDPLYIEVETSPGSRKLTAKSKIAHKHKAIQYANVIGGKLLDGFINSDESSFHQFIKKHCKSIADRGDCSITTEEFEPYKNIITTYKKSKKKSPRTIATNTITPKREASDCKANTVLRILDKLTSSRLPRYEIPSVPSTGSIVQREYKKTNPFDVYNDLVSSEYNPEALNDKRFAILYQLIMFISECVANGMSEEETLSAISSLRVVNKRDLSILRDREIRFKGLSKAERELVLECELCNNRDMTNLYIDLIHHHKQAKNDICLNDYIIGVLVKNYKESNAAWRLLKYIYLKSDKKSNDYIVEHRWTIMESYFIDDCGHGVKDMNETYYSLDNCFARLRYEYDHYIDMTRYNFHRDNITPDMLSEPTLKQYLPKRFDSKGRLCSLAMVSPLEADLFKSYDKRIVGDHIYVLFPVTSLTTKDLYSLLLTVNKQKKKHV